MSSRIKQDYLKDKLKLLEQIWVHYKHLELNSTETEDEIAIVG